MDIPSRMHRIATHAGKAATAFVEQCTTPEDRPCGFGARDDYTRLDSFDDHTFVLGNHQVHRKVDLELINTTAYAIGMFCLFFNSCVLSPESFDSLLDAIAHNPIMVANYIPTFSIETYGYSFVQIYNFAKDYVHEMNTSFDTIGNTWEDFHSIMASPLSSTFVDEVNIFALLVSAAEMNTV